MIILSKLVVLMLHFIACTGFINVYKDDANVKSKRSVADNFPLFGSNPRFSIAKTISRAPQSLSTRISQTVGQLLAPPVSQNSKEDRLHKQGNKSSAFTSNEYEPYDISTNVPVAQNPHVVKSIESSKTVGEYIISENKSKNGKSKLEYTTNISIIDESNKQNGTKNPFDDFMAIDQNLIDFIFSTSATEDDTTDYTTPTGDYENYTTTDEFLRIPAAAVASLLGK